MEIPGRHRNSQCRIRDFHWQGYRCLSLENEALRVVICPDKGCDIVEFTHKPTDTEVLYQSPWGLGSPHDRFAPAPGGPFRDRFSGGWFLMLPNGPEPCTHQGADHGHHGEACQLAWSATIVEDTPERIEAVFRVRLRRLPLAVERRVSLVQGEGWLTISETICNEGGEAIDVLWGHHPCLGEPFLETDCLIHLPDGQVAKVGEPMADFQVIQSRDGGRVSVINPHLGLEFALEWDAALFPVMGLWRVWDSGENYPNFSSRRIIALEPAVAFPSVRAAAEAGAALRLAPGEGRSAKFTANLCQKAKS